MGFPSGPMTTEIPLGLPSMMRPASGVNRPKRSRASLSRNPEATTLKTLPSKEWAPARI